ncbi:HAMP domain-containing histidine kinase [Curtobacterium sp. YC1]|uniref:sensor histidine kinase n=1 Tax=Curtobacterium sp. YC1 TaxID=2795488 RepID=UPI0018E5194B|nr:HAMP domain-containing sensor histidine kinase [Curtobacterium sp. YC1]QQD76616.1 HAMP domain-containing histidine kinase [Curtobacterium sp. YC1]
MTRTLTIRVRTAFAFAVASMVLTTAVLVFVNLASQQSFARTLPVLGRDGGPATRIPSAVPITPERIGASQTTLRVVTEANALQWQWSAVGVVVAGMLAGGVGWFVSRRMLRPIDRITATATRITASNLHERIALVGPDDELRRLSRTVDDLLDRLETAFESQRRFVAQASHELRTPLAVQRAAVQIGLHDDVGADDVRAVRDELLEQNRRTEHLVESLLVLAEADRGLDGTTQVVHVDDVTAEVVAGAARNAADVGVALTREARTGPPGLVVDGEPTLLRQLLGNLVGNAVEYNEPGGFVRVTTSSDGIVVENSGLAVPADEAPRLVEPFRRCSSARQGGRHSGLGLSIVASVVQAHGWSLSVDARPTGGLVVRVGVSPVQPRGDAGRNS